MKSLNVQGCLCILCQTLHQLLYKAKNTLCAYCGLEVQPGTSIPWELMHQHVLPGTAEGCGHGAVGGSSGEKRMPRVLHTSLHPQENSSPLNQSAVLKAELWEPQGEILTWQALKQRYNTNSFIIKAEMGLTHNYSALKKGKIFQNHIHPFSYPHFHLVENLIQKGVACFGKSG